LERYWSDQPVATSEATHPALDLPQRPRAITPRARRRSWNEAAVRVWAILSVLVLLCTIYFTATRISTALHDRWLIEQGTRVQARVDAIDESKQATRAYNRRDIASVDLKYNAPNGAPVLVMHVPLTPQPGTLRVGDTIPIRIDPSDPQRWTDRTQPKSWLVELTAVWFLLPMLALPVLAMFLRRYQMLKVWRTGEPAVAVVVDTKQSSIAPRSRVMRYALREGNDRRVFATLAPNSMGELHAGDEVMMVHAAGNPGKAVIAELYV
jgi:hypothetical protein